MARWGGWSDGGPRSNRASIRNAPASAEAQAAAGLSAYRRGDLPKAEEYFRKALRTDRGYAYALSGLASVACAVSKFKTCQDLMAQAYHASPADPQIIAEWADSLHGAEHIAALERALAIYDPASREARRLRVHIAVDKAAGDRKRRRLVSPYQSYSIELVPIGVDLRRPRGVGLRVRLNDTLTVRLILDTGASGISISAKAAAKSGLESLSDESTEVHGIGDRKPQESFAYLAAAVCIGDLRLADFPVEAFKAAKSDEYDGLIGADVFDPFQVGIDFQKMRLELTPWRDGQPPADGAADASDTLPAGYWRVFRFCNTLAVPTSINQGPQQPFVIDSGAWGNLIDTGIAQESTMVRRDYRSRLGGVQGGVDQVSRANKVSLVFAGFRQDSSDVLALSLESLGDQLGAGVAGILGMPVLRQMKMTIDYRNGAVSFQRSAFSH
jgi:tetratricopeptide (TPR) repeat protein